MGSNQHAPIATPGGDSIKLRGETGLKVIYPANCQNEGQATREMALLCHETKLHYHSLEAMASQNLQLEIKAKVTRGKNH